MALNKFPKGIIIQSTVKLFYKKYAYKICFAVDDDKIIKSDVGRGWYGNYTRNNLMELRHELKRRIIDKLPDELECKFRSEHKYVTMYLNDDAIFDQLVSRMHHCILEISVPANETHKQLIQDNHRIRVRNSLFLQDFRYKVNIKNGWTEKFTDFESLKTWLISIEPDGGLRWRASKPLEKIFKMTPEQRATPKFRYRFSSYAVYLNDEQDVMMLQLWLNTYYDSVEKAVLISET